MVNKLPSVLKAFRDVVVMCDMIKKAVEQILGKAAELDEQRSAAGVKPAKWNRDKDTVVASMKKMIDGVQADAARKRSVKSLVEKIEACSLEEIAAIQKKDKFKTKCQELLVPAADILEKMNEVDTEASATRLAIQALTHIKDNFLAKLESVEALPAI